MWEGLVVALLASSGAENLHFCSVVLQSCRNSSQLSDTARDLAVMNLVGEIVPPLHPWILM